MGGGASVKVQAGCYCSACGLMPAWLLGCNSRQSSCQFRPWGPAMAKCKSEECVQQSSVYSQASKQAHVPHNHQDPEVVSQRRALQLAYRQAVSVLKPA